MDAIYLEAAYHVYRQAGGRGTRRTWYFNAGLVLHRAQRDARRDDLVSFIDAHGGRLGAFRGYRMKSEIE